jgi:Rrf2 family transcriptional regulator, nitric oxide-sensitive transcriptional repressor
MRLLASTDIALRVLMLLGQQQAVRPVSVEILARTLGGLSRNHLHKIVQDLTALGFTRTVRGINGGVLLAMPADQIRLGSVIRHLEQDQPIAECFRADGCACTLVPGCRLRGMLAAASDSFYESLDEYTLADCLPLDGSPAVAIPDFRLSLWPNLLPNDTAD